MDTRVMKFHKYIEYLAGKHQYGQISVNVMVENGIPVLESIKVVVQKRYLYKNN